MAPNPQTVNTNRKNSSENVSRSLSGDEIVISGISGIFPKSQNTSELMENLYNKVDMVKEVKSDLYKHPGIPKYVGKMSNLNKFDAQFFRVTPWQAASLDPLTRKAMENAYGAIYDSGINPLSLGGSKLGVFVGSSYYDLITISIFNCLKINNYALSGGSKTMQANRISYWIDAKGPSVTIDQSCASSMTCLELAYNSMKRGDCDAAIVGGCNSCLHPILSINIKNAGHLCLDGKTKSFDKNGDGYVRSEAVSLLFLQKAKDAKRIYTEIYHIKGKFFTTPDASFLPMRNSEDMEKFLKEFYSEVKVSPSEVEYVEAFGSGIAEADRNELNAIGRLFTKTKSIKVGSVKSNMGHTEGASGTCAITKMCLAYKKGELPANLHFNEAQDDVPAIQNGRIQVVTENTPFNRGFTAVNSYSYTGANHHVLLKGMCKSKDKNLYRSNIPRIILLSGREEQGINKALDTLQSQPIDPEEIALLHNIYKYDVPGHTGRSYIVLDTNERNETVCLARSFEYYSGTTKPVCFLYSGMGSQWCGMGTELMRIPIFAAAIDRCRKVLDPLGVDIVKILTDSDQIIFDNILNSMVGICAVQIGLTDILKAMEIVPDNIIGHSIGELGCAYADGCFTAEETILSAYYRGLVSLQTPLIRGAMAAVGLGHKDVISLCPPEIQVACHNSANSATISGPVDIMKQFVSDLVGRGIFAKEVACSNIAYHSKYIAKAGPGLLSHMRNVIKEKKLRSNKWISTSVPQENWEQEYAKYASPEYFTNNLLNPVYFEENAVMIPKHAAVIEIAPHALLQAILKKSHADCVNVPLTKRGCPNPVLYLLEAVGQLYKNGSTPQVQAIYPKVEFPVSTETPLLSHLIEWEHSVDWPMVENYLKKLKVTSSRNIVMSIHDHKFLEGHIRNGVNELPESALLVFVWETLGMYLGKPYKDMSVTFSDITFHHQLKIDDEDVLKLKVMIQKGCKFEVLNENTPIVTGVIDDPANNIDAESQTQTDEEDITFSEEELYSVLSMKGYSYGGDFRSIRSLNLKRNEAYIKWTGEWTTFLDSLMQISSFVRGHDGISIPKIIRKLTIHVGKHDETRVILDGETTYKADMLNSRTSIGCGGVLLEGLIFDDKPKIEKQPDVLLSRKFVPHLLQDHLDLNTAITINLQLVADNVNEDKIKILKLSRSPLISNVIEGMTQNIPSHDFEINWIEAGKDSLNVQDVSGTNLFVVHNLLKNQKALNLIKSYLKEETFILTLEQNTINIENINHHINLETITSMTTDKGILTLLKKGQEPDDENITYIPIEYDTTFSWLPRVQNELQKSRRVVLVSEKQPYCGLFGLVNSLRKVNGNRIGLVIVDDSRAANFSPEKVLYKQQLQKTLTFNILKKGQWGSYYNVMNLKSAEIPNISLTSNDFANLDDLTWTETPISSGKKLIQVSYAGVSAKDCQKAVCSFRDNNYLFGMDFSGLDSNGNQVMGLVTGGALGRTVDKDQALVWSVPQHWTLEDAATVPLSYALAYYCLVIKLKLKGNLSVFVIGGCGALGQAIISLCLSLDCTVFTTVGDITKKRFLLRLFPKLQEENIGCSYDELFFAKMVNITHNKRCEYVINCSTGNLREAAMKCVGSMYIFLDVTDVDMNANKDFGMSFMQASKSYLTANLTSIFRPENHDERNMILHMVAEGIANGIVRPLTRVVYSPLEISRAFRLVSSRKNIGRALIRMDVSEPLNYSPTMNYSEGVHIVVCDKSIVGIKTSDHLVRRGAKNLIVNVKEYNSNNNFIHAQAVSWKKFGSTIVISSENLQTKEGCERLLNAGQKLGSVTGIFITQDYKDEIYSENIKQNDFKASSDENAVVVANMDNLSRNICKDLNHFVVISFPLQDNGNEYAFSACEKICEARNAIGLPALVLRSVLPKKIKDNYNNWVLKWKSLALSSLCSAMDTSLKYKYENILTFNLSKPTYDCVQETLQKILGVHNINDIDENLILGDMSINIEEIISELSLNNISTNDLRKMTLASLKNLCRSTRWRKTNFNAGLRAFYNFVDKKEYDALDTFVPAKTTVPTSEKHGYLDRYDTHLIMIPGFEGHHHIFKTIAERLKVRAATLQLGPDIINGSIPEMAAKLTELILTNFEKTSKFYILGYSFGVNVALEVAKLFEAEGRTGVVYCLDSSPDTLREQVNAYTGNLSERKLQNSILEHMCRLMTGVEDIELQEDLEKVDNCSDKISICMKQLGSVNFSNEYKETVLRSACNRIILAREYQPDFKLESELVLIRGIPHPKITSLPDDYNLSKLTKKPVKVFHIDSDHVSAPYDCRVPSFVNEMLDPLILEEYKKKNLCQIYF